MKSIAAIVLLMFLAACTSEGAQRFSGAYGGINGGAGADSTARP